MSIIYHHLLEGFFIMIVLLYFVDVKQQGVNWQWNDNQLDWRAHIRSLSREWCDVSSSVNAHSSGSAELWNWANNFIAV